MKKQTIFKIMLMLLLAFINYYIFLPVINLKAFSFYFYLILLIIDFFLISMAFNITDRELRFTTKLRNLPKYILIPMGFIITIVVVIIVINILVSPIFNAKSYSRRINVNENGNFASDISEVDFSKVPLLDKDSSSKLGDRVMGQYSEYVSQFYVSDRYTQINYNDEILRVTPLEYDGFIKWLFNRNNGIGAYITVNSVNGETKLIKLDKGIKYSESAMFNDNLARKIRFSYPFTITGEEKFEIDNDGNPYYIIPTLSYTGISLKTKVTGAIIFDPITGESKKYDLNDIPKWVDNVYSADLIIEQVNDWGTYKNGFINSIFGQKNVVNTTEGYNYLALNDDIYLYTGITSVSSDESNLGFILSNLRTKETTFYDVAGAEEYSAMESAKGQVQQMNYDSTFPLLINVNSNPTYLISLKDNAGLVKMYAFVDVRDYQKVSVSDAALGINKALENYLKLNVSNNISDDLLTSEEITIKSISSDLINSNTNYYIVDSNDNKYNVSINVSNKLPFVSIGDKLKIYYYSKNDITEIIKID